MLTNLNWLKVGEEFPPKCERERLEGYRTNRDLFECKHAQVYKETFERIERVIGNFEAVVSYPILLNFQKLLSLKIADLLLGEPPIITNTEKQKVIDDIESRSSLQNTTYQVVVDASRYGDGLFYIRKEGNLGIIDIANPQIWFPIVSDENVRDVQNHVLAWTRPATIEGKDQTLLTARVHYKGYYDETIYLMEGGMIQRIITPMKRFKTGLTDFAIVQVSNIITSDRSTGIDDYIDIDSIISELMVRLGQVSKILDKHAGPSMSGPLSALERDPVSGEWRLKTATYFPRESTDDPSVEYITWDGQLESNFTQIEKLMNLLYTISEMGSAMFGDLSSTTGQVPSGSALKRLMISPLAKVNRIRMRLDPALKKSIALCSQLGPSVLLESDITIKWQDGLPGDPLEESEIIKNRTNGCQTMSVQRVLTTFDGMNEKSAEEEIALISDEEAMTNPLTPPPFSTGEGSEPPEEEESIEE